MALQHQPSGDRNYYDFARYFRPSGSTTVVWAQDMTHNTLVRLLKWGNDIYLPVYDGMRLGIGLYNGSAVWRAYPTYIEARNMWDGGPAQPEDCSTDYMWELRPWMSMVADKLMNPQANVGRPFIITPSGEGMTVGESTFGTDEFRGQIRVYERLQLGGGHQTRRQTNVGTVTRGASKGGLESFGGEESTRGAAPQSYGHQPEHLGFPEPVRGGRAGIGAGAEEYQAHSDTGVSYQRNTQPVVFFRVEYRVDLQPMLNNVWGTGWGDWHEPMPHQNDWWDTSWTWRPSRPTAPEVPVVRPHRPRS